MILLGTLLVVMGLLAGLIGGIIGALLAIPIQMAMGPWQQEWMTQIMAGQEDMPPEMRDVMERMAAGSAFAVAGAVINSKFLRIKENVLLRTLGARTKQITRITLIEYAYLGVFSAITGMVLSLGGGFLLTKFFFEITFAFDWIELLVISLGVILLTVAIGWFNSREVINTPPLQVLRKEG